MNTVASAHAGKGKLAGLLLLAALLTPLGAVASGASTATPGAEGLRNEQQILKQRKQEYLREHSDPSGKVPRGAYVKGIEHVRQMKVAPYIGARPLGQASPTASSNPKTK